MNETQQEVLDLNSWVLVHIITKLEIGGAQFATFDALNHASLNFKDRLLLSGAGGALDRDLKKLCLTENRFIESLDREVNPINDLKAFLQITKLLWRYKKTHPERKLLVHTHL